MTTIDSKQIVDDIIAGKYPKEGWVKIVKYTNAWGGTAYGCMTKHMDQDSYTPSEYVIDPVLYWEKK